jgi:predicted aspartyl protease
MTLRGTVEPTGDPTVVVRVRANSLIIQTRPIVDTGFNGAVSLDVEDVRSLRLTPIAEVRYRLADGSYAESNVYDVEIEWLGVWKRVEAVETSDGALVGTQALFGHRLVVDFVPGGQVQVAPL